MNDDPIYQLPDDDDDLMANFGDMPGELPKRNREQNPAQDTAETPGQEDAPSEEDGSQTRPRSFSPILAMLRILVGPVEGWRALKRARVTQGRMATGCFIPLLLICAISETSKIFFEASNSFHSLLVEATVTVVSYFFGYYLALLLPGIFFPKDCRDVLKTEFFRVFVMTAMSTLAFFHIALNVLPMFGPVLVFLPLWTIYSIARGVRLLRVPKDHETAVAGLISLFVIGCPLFCGWLLYEILP